MVAGDIPFRKEMTFEYGVPQQVSPLVRRVVARNPSHTPFTAPTPISSAMAGWR